MFDSTKETWPTLAREQLQDKNLGELIIRAAQLVDAREQLFAGENNILIESEDAFMAHRLIAAEDRFTTLLPASSPTAAVRGFIDRKTGKYHFFPIEFFGTDFEIAPKDVFGFPKDQPKKKAKRCRTKSKTASDSSQSAS